MAADAAMRIGKAKLNRRGLPAWFALSLAPPAAALPFAFVFVFVHSLFPSTRTQPLPYVLMSIGFGIALSLVALAAAWSFGLAWHIPALRRRWRAS
jgi:hypothetical protein